MVLASLKKTVNEDASSVSAVVHRLRGRQAEIEGSITACVCTIVTGLVNDLDSEYEGGLRVTVTAAVDFGLTGLERGGPDRVSIPPQTLAQAQRAARSGVSLDTVLRRYHLGHTLLLDFIMEETSRFGLDGSGNGLRGMLRTQASLLDRLTVAVAREYFREMERVAGSPVRSPLEMVRMLLGGELIDSDELGYDLDGVHLGVIAQGQGCQDAVRDLAQSLDRRLLCVVPGRESAWGWLGGQHAVHTSDLERVFASLDEKSIMGNEKEDPPGEVSFSFGEPASGLDGWRLTHRQAQAALLISLRMPRRVTRYVDVALLALALSDEMLATSLVDMYLSPLDDVRDRGPVLRQTLRAYLDVDANVSSAAAVLGVARTTVENRLHAIEERIGRPLRPCPAELEVALRLDELGAIGDGKRRAEQTRFHELR